MRSCNASFKLSLFSVRVWHVCSLVGWLCFRYSDVIIRIFGWRSCLAVLNGRCLIRTGINRDIFSWSYQVYFFLFLVCGKGCKRFSLDCSPIMFNRELVFSSGLFSLNNSANANSSSFFIWRRFKSISSSSFSKLLLLASCWYYCVRIFLIRGSWCIWWWSKADNCIGTVRRW